MITLTQKYERAEDRKLGSAEGSFNALHEYKKEFFDLYAEMITAVVDRQCKHLIPDNATVRVMEVRTAAELHDSDDVGSWLNLASLMFLIQRNAETAGDSCCEIYHRGATLAHRAQVIIGKMRRSDG